MAEMSGETLKSIEASSTFPGFRFAPTDEELISYYLKKKLEGSDKCVEVISEVEINKYEPWDLPAKSVVQSESEWFFFSSRGRKYPNGSQSERATESGYWKATGKERNVKSGSNVIGTKRTLVFHTGRAPKGERTEWIMHEYCMSDKSQNSMVICRLKKNAEFRLNDSPRQGSSSRRHENTSNLAAEDNSRNSHSVEQQSGTGSDSDQRERNEFCQTSSSHQGCDDEDCYAEVLKDDIVDLGQSLLPPTPSEKSEDKRKSRDPVEAIPLRGFPLQGTANRRIRLRKHKTEKYYTELLEVEIVSKNATEKSVSPNADPSPKYLLGLFSNWRINRLSMSMLLLILILLVLFVCLLRAPWQVKKFALVSLF
ncbi:NAC domain-containing protein [Actinidia chinensis var. chinensis]|uniref:NAC domain-containing protein n=1 Tax=Actinidia chinensis var. chinensis TaxID=1590841 RepID=A0A2R6P742_ACTCC|nr:NAC domain-containing protein [Actinidia chinensis var. chinensis]